MKNVIQGKLKDKRLPYTAYLVQYEEDGKTYHDISIANKAGRSLRPLLGSFQKRIQIYGSD